MYIFSGRNWPTARSDWWSFSSAWKPTSKRNTTRKRLSASSSGPSARMIFARICNFFFFFSIFGGHIHHFLLVFYPSHFRHLLAAAFSIIITLILHLASSHAWSVREVRSLEDLTDNYHQFLLYYSHELPGMKNFEAKTRAISKKRAGKKIPGPGRPLSFSLSQYVIILSRPLWNIRDHDISHLRQLPPSRENCHNFSFLLKNP